VEVFFQQYRKETTAKIGFEALFEKAVILVTAAG